MSDRTTDPNEHPLPPDPVRYAPFDPGLPTIEAARAFHERMSKRRSIRFFSDAPVDVEVIREIVMAASTAPSGAHKQPWRFVAVGDAALKREIRLGAEEEERAFYGSRAGESWLSDLQPFGTDTRKPFLETAPWLIVVFKLAKCDDGSQVYYANESVGIAVGFLLAALHHAGLCALTHTPSPLKFLTRILDRPDNERPFLLIPVGYPAAVCFVPRLARKPENEVLVVHD